MPLQIVKFSLVVARKKAQFPLRHLPHPHITALPNVTYGLRNAQKRNEHDMGGQIT